MKEIRRTPSGGYAQDWPAYDAAQINEKRHLLAILCALCNEVQDFERTTGRKPFPLSSVLLCLVYKVYLAFSSRRCQGFLQELRAENLIAAVPKPTVLCEYMREEALTDILKGLVIKSSLPLAEVENVFAVDSTGLSVPKKRIWFNKHKGRREKRRDYIKLHAMCGVRTNIITSVETTEGTANDRPYLKRLVEGTARYFEISQVSADGGYPSGENFRAVVLSGGIPYIAFHIPYIAFHKTNTLDADYKSTVWKDMLHLYKSRHPQFVEHYYLRNNVEATFHSLKSKFGGRLRSKSLRGQFNEALCKALCHNLCVLIHSMYELGIDPTSWAEAKLTPRAEAGMIGRAMSTREAELVSERLPTAPPPATTAVVRLGGGRRSRRVRYVPTDQTSLFGELAAD
jgi:hypothetical protein